MHVFYTLRIGAEPFCEIGGLVVDERHRRKGRGKQLLETAKRWCEERKCRMLRVRSNIVRRDANRFYLKAGFNEMKEQKVFGLTV